MGNHYLSGVEIKMESSTILMIGFLVFIGMVSYFVKIEWDKKKDQSKSKANSYKELSVITDFVHNKQIKVTGIEYKGNEKVINFSDGTKYDLNQSQLELLNPFEVMVGKPALFVYGAPKSKQLVKELMEKIEHLKEQLAIVQASASERRNREVNTIKEVAKRPVKGEEK